MSFCCVRLMHVGAPGKKSKTEAMYCPARDVEYEAGDTSSLVARDTVCTSNGLRSRTFQGWDFDGTNPKVSFGAKKKDKKVCSARVQGTATPNIVYFGRSRSKMLLYPKKLSCSEVLWN